MVGPNLSDPAARCTGFDRSDELSVLHPQNPIALLGQIGIVSDNQDSLTLLFCKTS